MHEILSPADFYSLITLNSRPLWQFSVMRLYTFGTQGDWNMFVICIAAEATHDSCVCLLAKPPSPLSLELSTICVISSDEVQIALEYAQVHVS